MNPLILPKNRLTTNNVIPYVKRIYLNVFNHPSY